MPRQKARKERKEKQNQEIASGGFLSGSGKSFKREYPSFTQGERRIFL